MTIGEILNNISYSDLQQLLMRFLRGMGEPVIYSDSHTPAGGGTGSVDMTIARLKSKITPAANFDDPLYIVEGLTLWHDDTGNNRNIEVVPFVGGTNYGLMYGETVASVDYTYNIMAKLHLMTPMIIDAQRWYRLSAYSLTNTKSLNIRGRLLAVERSGRLISG